MSKALKNKNLSERPATRALLAVSLSVSMAAFGCTTDRTLGNGDPVTTPGVRTAPTGGTTSGSETTPPSMTSSSGYNSAQALPTVTPRVKRLSAAEAAAVIAQQQPRGRYHGPAYPGNSGGYASDGLVTGQFQNPALRTNPQITINSSLTSQPTSAIAGGGDGAVAVGGSGGVSAGAFITGTTAASTLGASTAAPTGITAAATNTGTGLSLGGNAGSGGAPIFASTTASPLGASSGLPFNVNSGAASPTIAPTAFSSFNPPTAISGFPALAAQSTVTQSARTNANANVTAQQGTLNNTNNNFGSNLNNNTTNAITNNATATNANATTNVTTNARMRAGTTSATGAVRIARDANGRPVITNSNSTIR